MVSLQDCARIASYGRAEINYSEHKPVHSLLEVNVRSINSAKQDEVVHRLHKQFLEQSQLEV